MLLWFGELVAEIVGQVLFEVFLLKVARFPVVLVLFLFRRRGRSFDRYWTDTKRWEIGHGLLGLSLCFIIPLAFR